MTDERKAAIAEGFSNLPHVKDAWAYGPGEADEVGNLPMAAVRLDFERGSTYLCVADDVWADLDPEDVAGFYRDLVAQYAERNSPARDA